MTIATARKLRREMTDAERRLWSRLRDSQLGVKFRRQMPIDRFIVDFASEEAKLVIEADGSQHAIAEADDEGRSRVIEARGYLVLRFWNNDILERIDSVMEEIVHVLSQRGALAEPLSNLPLP